MTVSQTLLNFLDYYLSRVQVEPEISFAPDKGQRAGIQASFVVGRDPSQKQRFDVTLSVKIYKGNPDDNLPYIVDFTIIGRFWSNLTLTSRGVPVQSVTNAISLLYGVARGVVGQLTAGGVNDRFVLPSVTFDDLVKRGAGETGSNVITAQEHNDVASAEIVKDETPSELSKVPSSASTASSISESTQPSAGTQAPIELVARFHGVLLSLQEFDNTEVRPRIDAGANHTLAEVCVIGTYLRTLSNIRTLVALRDAGNFQAIAMIARALFELAIDIRLLREIPDAPEKVMAFAEVEKLLAARKIVAMAVDAKVEPSDIHTTFIRNNAAAIEGEWQRFWPNQKPPRHWSGMNLRKRAQILKAPFDAMYETNYKELSWYVHGGLTGVANLEADVFPLLCGTSYEVAIESYRETLRSVIEQLGLHAADANIEKKLEFARLLPFTSGPDEAIQLRQEVLGY
jgi:preprotein translocase subunit SecB